jgi:hypothetical protein
MLKFVTSERLRVGRKGYVIAAALTVAAMTPGVAAADPTCADTLGISVHAQHIVGDYVAGVGAGTLGWPPAGQVGAAVSANRGPVVRGGPGPGFHFPNGFAPGASFCTNSNSPGAHL